MAATRALLLERSSSDADAITCDDTREATCAAERAHRVTAAEPRPVAPDGDVPWALDFCRRADTVVEGFLCSEPVVVSDACRKPTNLFDEFVCDEPRMHRLQWAVLRETWAIVKAIGLVLVRGKP